MPAKKIPFDDPARRQLARGGDKLAEAVKVTFGPRGRTVLPDKPWGAPTVTKDGVSVAREVELDDPFEDLGAALVEQFAARTPEVAGDRTTTATILAPAISRDGVRLVAAGVNPRDLQRGIQAGAWSVVAELERLSQDIDGPAEVAQVAPLSATGDETIGGLIADAMERVDREGVVTVSATRAAVEAGVIDPTKVVRVALQSAASVTSLMLMPDAIVAQEVS